MLIATVRNGLFCAFHLGVGAEDFYFMLAKSYKTLTYAFFIFYWRLPVLYMRLGVLVLFQNVK